VKEEPMKTTKVCWFVLPLSLSLVAACGDGDDEGGTGYDAGSGGSSQAGSGGKGGSGGSSSAKPRGKDNPPELGDQIDRMGRPAISTALVETFNPDEDEKGEAKDAYNFAQPEDWSEFIPEFETSLGILDALDGECGNQLLAETGSGAYEALATVLVDDQLYVDTDKGECTEYLGVEAEALELVTDGSCGGRTPEYDVIERSYSVLAAGALAGVDDTITEDDVALDLDTFPFLAEPQ
jgi:hypothetical protein